MTSDAGAQPLPPAARPSASASRRALAAEIASLASALLLAAGLRTEPDRGRRPVGYGLIACLAAFPGALALLLLVLSGPSWLRAMAGLAAVASLSFSLAAAAAAALLRWSPPATPGPTLPRASAQALRTLAAAAAAAVALSAGATWLLASASRSPDVAPALARVMPELASVAPPDLPPEERADHALKREGHVLVSGGVLHAPPSFRSEDGAFDLLVHFHGNTALIEESFGAAGVNALVYIVNAGVGSGPYEKRYTAPGSFADVLRRVEEAAATRGLKGARLRRLALASWSGGYRAVEKILSSPGDAGRVDAVLLLDGMRLAYRDDKKTEPDLARLAPFVRFARAAAEGRKLFSVTHGPADAADALLREVGATRAPATATPPRVDLKAAAGVMSKKGDHWLEQTSEARLQGLHVRGYAGRTPEHHMAHLVQMSVTVLPELADWWNR